MRLRTHLLREFPFTWRITIADNGSTDGTGASPTRLARDSPGVRRCTSTRKGRGRALRAAWSAATRASSPTWTSTCRPTSTRCSRSSRRWSPGHSDIAIGSRLAPRRVGRARPEARGHLARVQPHLPRRVRDPVPRRAVRVQGGPRRRRPAAAAGDRGRRVVLRHRAARCSPIATACGSTRCRSTGSTTPTAGSTSCRPRSTTSGVCGAWVDVPSRRRPGRPRRRRPARRCLARSALARPHASQGREGSSPSSRPWARHRRLAREPIGLQDQFNRPRRRPRAAGPWRRRCGRSRRRRAASFERDGCVRPLPLSSGPA